MNTKAKPFSSQLAREAVVTGLNQNAMNRLGSGTLLPGCFFLPPHMIGHPTGTCPYGNPGNGDLAKAKRWSSSPAWPARRSRSGARRARRVSSG